MNTMLLLTPCIDALHGLTISHLECGNLFVYENQKQN